MSPVETEWMREVREFEESKKGVKGLLDSGIETIPRIFVHPPEHLFDLKQCSTQFKIPIFDLSNPDRSNLISQIKSSFSKTGYFHVINHGIPIQVMENTIKAVQSFHEEPMKSAYVWDEKVVYLSSANISWSKALNWKDTLRVFTSPNPPDPQTIPSVCRNELMEWDVYMKGLGESVMELVCEGLGLNPNRLKDLSCLEMRKFGCHYYPYCPQPDLTLGIPTHKDRGVLTLLLQNELSGLQFKYGDEWVEVKPLPGAILVNAGDVLQILSNDEIRSVEHRVIANACKQPRISVAVIFNPSKRGELDYYGPFPELSSPENPTHYRNFTIPEILKQVKVDDYISTIFNLLKLNNGSPK